LKKIPEFFHIPPLEKHWSGVCQRPSDTATAVTADDYDYDYNKRRRN
jgi:hypothetical protein